MPPSHVFQIQYVRDDKGNFVICVSPPMWSYFCRMLLAGGYPRGVDVEFVEAGSQEPPKLGGIPLDRLVIQPDPPKEDNGAQ